MSASRVLIVDDESAIVRAYSRILEARGYSVDTASCAQEALDLMCRVDVDVILSDLTMPGMTGIDFLRAARERAPDVPVIMMTGSPSTESAVDAMERGALRYLTKPVARDILERALNDAVHFRQAATLRRRAEAVFGDDAKRLQERADLAAALGRALDGLHLAYQPIVSWSRRRILGYEALVRSPEAALPHPGALFDAAEQLDAVEVLGRAIRRLAPGPLDRAEPEALLFVNLHTRDLMDDDLFDAGTPLARVAGRVVLEITERASLQHVDDIHARIARLREMGFRIAVDDIGAGYAGLTSFALLEPDVVKIDMALVRDVDKRTTKTKLIATLVALCRDLDIMLIAAGVETVAERDTLLEIGCDHFQGYLFGRPAPPFAPVVWP
jgi:EAL domain-containing protein (putative c-di-GMP-specific phosphodiesterase class I)